ncbi:MAG: zinc metallopeptidase [Eubacteriales bacterium]|nr:zinc metallopeptidase [Eubacteriales bacterium]
MAYYGYYYYDVTYLLVIIGAILSMIASAGVNSTFKKYSRVRSMSGMTGAQTARRILDQNGLQSVKIEHINGNLTDHYDPRSKVLRLSDATYSSTSVAAVGVAAHECGHAVQDNESYGPLRIRSRLAPAANFGSRFGLPIFVLGLVFGANEILMQIGIWVFLLAVLFQLVTLPVEFDASKRALAMLEGYGILGTQEAEGSRKVLKAAAMTYVAAAAAAILNLLRLILIARRSDRD